MSSSITTAADEQRNNFLRHINRRIQEDDSSNTTTIINNNNNNNNNNNSNGGTTTTATTTTMCEPCPVCDAQPSTNSTSSFSSEKIKLRFLVAERDFARLQVMLEQMADDYTRKLGADAPEITVVGLPTLAEVEREVKFDVFSGASQFDGYIITPLWIGELAKGLFDTTEFMKEYSETTDPTYWTDILLFYREVISSYDNNLYLFPFDGDVISMFYRRDLLDKYDKDVPKTWDEYNELAAFFDGKTDEIDYGNGTVTNVTLSGSCIGRQPQCGNPYWAQTVLATMTQIDGTYEGSLFDSSNLSPLLGPAMEETLRILGEQTKYGVKEEFEGCVGVHVEAMNQGRCALTYNWGNSFSDHIRDGSTVRGKLGVAPTPGSTVVFNRKTGKLEECTEDLCPFAVPHGKTGKLINQAPYGAYGGFSGAVSNSVSYEHKIAAANFFAFATSAKKAIKYVIPDANNPDANPVPTGMDPYAQTMLDVNAWTSRGFDKKSTEEYVFAIESQLGSSNVVIDIRTPAAADIYAALDEVTTSYCNDTKFDQFSKDPSFVRADLSAELANKWKQIIADFDAAEGRVEGAWLELYQRDRGVYTPPVTYTTIQRVEGDDKINSGAIVAIVICTATVVAIIFLLITLFMKQSSARKREHEWYVNPNDIRDTKEVLGRGSFGVVTKGFLRGTPVALKHAKGWEPDTIKNVEQLPSHTDPNRASVTSSISVHDDADAEGSTIGASLFTENPTDEGRCFWKRNRKNHGADESLRAELLLLVKLRHDNIVQTLGASQDTEKKQLVLILQYMENGPIRNVLKDRNGVAGTAGMSVELQWALQVAEGLNFLHTIPPPAGPMVHADLKSSNVLLDSSYNANISDFGLATRTMGGLWGAIQRSTKPNNPRGSILWMAPEILNGAEPSPASDVYSYSMFLVELMTRDRPFGVRVFEARGDGDERRMSEFSAGTEFDRRSFSDSERQGSISVETPLPVKNMKNELNESKPESRDDRRVSWSIAEEASGATASASNTDDNLSKTTLTKSASGKLKSGRDFYAVINGETLSRNEIVERVKNIALDPPFRPTLPDNAPQILIDICTECWQKNPKRRPAMSEVKERLQAATSTSLVQSLLRRGSVFDSILPPDVQDKLSRGEMVKPQTYDNVTVIFSDIVGFTSISAGLTAEESGDLIYRLFTKFDTLCHKHGVKKLDVIGDAFLGVVGIPNGLEDHAIRASRFALDCINVANETLICSTKPQLGYARVRFGAASGSAVATVIGSSQHPKYTLFGDAVNTASRMESTSSPNKCQVTEETANLIRGYSEMTLVSRGKRVVKGKGEMETFFVEKMK